MSFFCFLAVFEPITHIFAIKSVFLYRKEYTPRLDKFGFLLDALKFGCPPHGGIAFGLDRLVMLMSGAASIREVMAFPKTQTASCLLTQAPSEVNNLQLRELGIKLRAPKVEEKAEEKTKE